MSTMDIKPVTEHDNLPAGQTEQDKIDDNSKNHGRVIQQQEHNRTYLEAFRKDPKLLFWIGVMVWTMVVRGFENQSSGSVISIPDFKRRFGKLEAGTTDTYFIETSWQSALSGGSNAASVVGSMLASYTADRFGIKPILLCASVLNIGSVGLEFGCTSIRMFFAGKMLNFIAIGAFQNLCTSYVSEVSPLAIRASTIGFCNLAQCIGPFISAIMSYFTAQWTDDPWSWKALLCAQWGFSGISFACLLFMPESPVFLVEKGRFTAARQAFGRLYSDPHDADSHLERVKLTLEEAETHQVGSYIDCFRGTNRRRTYIAIFVFLAEAMSGLGFVSNYGSLMYQYLGISDRRSFLIQIGAQILSISGATISFLVGDFLGRRPMFITGCTCLMILLLCMGISGSVTTTAGVTASVGFYTMFNFFYNAGVGSNVYAIGGEIATSALRTKTIAIAVSVLNAANTMWSFVSPYMFNPGYGNLKAKIGFVFAVFMLLFAILAYFWVPETRLRTYEELDELFINRVPARQFKAYKTVAEQRASEAYNAEKKTQELENV